MEMTTRWYQSEAKENTFAWIRSNPGKNPLIVMPTGTGKSVVIADIITSTCKSNPAAKFLVLTHSSVLVKQNALKLLELWKTAPAGVHSAGIGLRDTHHPIIFGGIQSVAPTIEKGGRHFGRRDYVIVDEAHAISDVDSSMYAYVISELKKINPDLIVIGLTATPYRLDVGLLTDGKLFDGVSYDLTTPSSWERLIFEGYLCPIKSVAELDYHIDVSSISVHHGDFDAGQLDKLTSSHDVIAECCDRAIEYAKADQRKRWMVFASGIESSELICDYLVSRGINAEYVHSKRVKQVNSDLIEAFKDGRVDVLVSGAMLTTGFDCPEVDYIVDIAPTISASRHVQKLGRGTRPSGSKKDCMYADFGGNLERLGPINAVKIPEARRYSETSEKEIKVQKEPIEKREAVSERVEIVASSKSAMLRPEILGIQDYVMPTCGFCVTEELMNICGIDNFDKRFRSVSFKPGYITATNNKAVVQAYIGYDFGSFSVDRIKLMEFLTENPHVEAVGVSSSRVSFWTANGKKVFTLENLNDNLDYEKVLEALHICKAKKTKTTIEVDGVKVSALLIPDFMTPQKVARCANISGLVIYCGNYRASIRAVTN